ncbi:putative NACHT family NTPase [Bradyrhizobium sp. RT9b]|uniref:NACHT domain-containing protein n=1 Tax=Bradyrhizobium sp. RT9b TaxID=3156385 RepID=UPI0033939508
MIRTVRQTNIKSDLPQDGEPRPFADFETARNLVLLGDPGAGKTHVFKEAAAAEGGRFIKARAFLVMPASMLVGQALFIDGLDEKRAGRGDRDTVDAVVTKLFEVNPAKVRISCRVADWLGASDLAALQPYFEQHDETPVLLLQSLSRPEQVAVLAAQGAGRAKATAFLAEATERGLGDFLENPQNLIMLWRAVKAGNWPATRKALFEVSTKLLLQEFDQERARSGSGSFTVAELRPIAGAVCAARLISDVEAISLTDQEGTEDIPGYRSITFFPPEKVQAALGRRIFDAGQEPETVDYSHRTTAEYLAAEFLAARVRDGLPFGRVVALLGVDGHPAVELRGLHAWLAVHLPERADELIEADPYGVLTYGDAASLTPSSCACLVRALDRLSKENPWFRSGNWESKSIGGLARLDMVGEFRTVLNHPDSGFGVRSVVVDALALGTPIPVMLADLAAVLARQTSPFAERARALAALLRYGADGETAMKQVFDSALGKTANDLRLRTEIICALYGRPYGAAEVVALLNDAQTGEETASSAIFWKLADGIPLADLAAVLDGIVALDDESKRFDRRGWEVGSLYARVLVRAWRAPGLFNPERAIAWLRKRVTFKGGHTESRARDLRAAMRETPERLTQLAQHFFRTVPLDENQWLSWHRFREVILFELNADALLDIVFEELRAAAPGSDRRVLLCEVAFSLCYQAKEPHGSSVFDQLFALPDTDAALGSIRSRATASNLPPRYFEGRTSQKDVDIAESREKQRQDFDRNIEQIRSGLHAGWLLHIMRFYFAWYDELDREGTPRARVASWFGEERTDDALEGLAAALSRDDLPSFADIVRSAAEQQYSDWWYVLSAGLNERMSAGQGLSGLSDDFLKGMLVFDVAHPVYEPRDGVEHVMVLLWRTDLMERRPELVRDAYREVARARLARGHEFADGLHELLNEPAFESSRADIVLELIRDYPNASPFRLDEMLIAAAKLPVLHDRLLTLAGTVLAGNTLAERQRDLWIATAYMLAPATFEDDVRQRAAAHPAFLFDLRDKSGFADRTQPAQPLPLPMAEFLVRLAGSLFAETPHPSRGWSGNMNAWDAADWVRSLVNSISASPSQAATEALERLRDDSQLASYQPHVLHALANQRQRRRDAEYDRPDWAKTIAALNNGRPATVADLHALLVAHLVDLKHRIARTNTDIFKQFWNLDSHAKPTKPRPEEACRDDLVNLMRPSLLPLEITVEPEGHMVADKRADISVAMPSRKILCELKRDYHAEVWTAIQGQLERYYAHDPDAKGFGVYCVFWFGDKRPYPIPAPPNGVSRPQSAAEMEQMLVNLMPQDMRQRLAAIVIDVSGSV